MAVDIGRGANSLLWSDEFDGVAGSPPDERSWRHETGRPGWRNDELQTYTDATGNAFHDGDGNLVIRALRTPGGYTSARLRTKGLREFRYGRIEVRALLPTGAGLWSAIWALGSDIDEAPWPACGEIDIVEHVGREPARIFGTLHCPGRSGKDGVSGGLTVARPFDSGFRVFAVDWAPDAIDWSVDGSRYFTTRRSELGKAWAFDHPFFLVINLAVGGWLGGAVAPETEFPADMKIDYVRIYDRPPLART